jgi:serine/threonine-protein kinase
MELLIRNTVALAVVVSITACGAASPTLRATGVPMVTPVPVLSGSLEPDGMIQVYVPAGEFLMGWDGTGVDDAEMPQHRVYLDAFWIDRTEVTNAMFRRFVAATSYTTWAERSGIGAVGGHEIDQPGANWQHPTGPNSDLARRENHPVVQVSWEDAMAYCAWASRRLPTEAEWEKAARGTDGRVFPWGNDLPTADRANGADRRIDDGYAETAPVGSYPAGASPYGVLDMAGNVTEWVSDWWDVSYYAHSPVRNPTGPTTGATMPGWDGPTHVTRGGSFIKFVGGVYSLRTTQRWPASGETYYAQGFRCARSP